MPAESRQVHWWRKIIARKDQPRAQEGQICCCVTSSQKSRNATLKSTGVYSGCSQGAGLSRKQLFAPAGTTAPPLLADAVAPTIPPGVCLRENYCCRWIYG